MIYVYTPAHNYATLKRMPLFNFPLVWNAVGVERNNPRQHLFINHQRNALLLDLQWEIPPPPPPSPHCHSFSCSSKMSYSFVPGTRLDRPQIEYMTYCHNRRPFPILHCKEPILEIRNIYSQKRNCATTVPISTFMCLWAIYFIPTVDLPILLQEICGQILGIYKSLTDTWM